MINISLLGATGSIGSQTIDIIRMHPNKFTLMAMSFGTNMKLARKIISEFKPKIISVTNIDDAKDLQLEIGSQIKVYHGIEGLIEVATYKETNILVNAVVGSIGLIPTLKAIEAKKNIALANKETLVIAGHLVMENAKKNNVRILPIDSEHSAIFQSLNGENYNSISKIILTASGGSFRDKTIEELKNVTVDQALCHPNWSMGKKITIDSATMMNKGLEVIEAKWLFDIDYDQIEVLLHKESIIHSMVEFKDTSIIAQLGLPDMRVPIQYALTYPNRLEIKKSKQLKLHEISSLNFSTIDLKKYHCLALSIKAGKIGHSMPIALNAANEVAVEAFLNKQINFLQIQEIIEKSLNCHEITKSPSLEEISLIDVRARKLALNIIKKGGHN